MYILALKRNIFPEKSVPVQTLETADENSATASRNCINHESSPENRDLKIEEENPVIITNILYNIIIFKVD